MALRLLEVYIASERAEDLQTIVKKVETLGVWTNSLPNGQHFLRMLIPLELTEPLMDRLQNAFSDVPNFRVLLLEVDATIPRPEPQKNSKGKAAEEKRPAGRWIVRVSRDELYAAVEEGGRMSFVFFALIGLSTVVAAIGLLENDVAIIIAAMVIAPLLTPNVALALATTLGDSALAKRALSANGVGLFMVISLAAIIGAVVPVNPAIPQVASRTTIGIGAIALAVVSGVAGSLSVTTRIPSAFIGVMVAVALVPPLVVLGMLLGSAQWVLASKAFLLVLVNLIGINLAGVVTFVAEGIQPLRWWDTRRARRAIRIAIPLWTALLAVLVAVILLSGA